MSPTRSPANPTRIDERADEQHADAHLGDGRDGERDVEHVFTFDPDDFRTLGFTAVPDDTEHRASRLAGVVGDHGESERAKAVRIEGKDVFDIALVGEHTGRVIDE